jgi:hypothetical protein
VRTDAAGAAPRSRALLGLVLIGIGLLLTLDSAGILRSGGIGRWWPLLPIGIGIVKVRQPRADGQRAAGVAFLLLGGFFLLMNVLAIGAAWPLLMVAFGVFLLWRGLERPQPEAVPPVPSPYITEMALMGYLKRIPAARNFQGGSVTAVMAGVELDLRQAALADGTAVIDVVAFWGGIEIKVPRGWTVDGRVVPLMGGFENKAEPAPPGSPRIVVRGHAIMGAVVIGS